MFSTNAASLVHHSKKFCLKREIERTKATIFTIQETCFKSKGTFKVKDFVTFEAIQGKEKSGIMIGAHKSLSPVLIAEYNSDFELLVVEVHVNNKHIRVMTGVGPHENKLEDVRMPFFLALEEEIHKAELEGKSIYIEIDANSKLGPERIPNDKHKISNNGQILAAMLDRHALFVANSSQKCSGLITRKRVTTVRTEESSIDLVITSSDMIDNLVSLQIDDARNHVLTKLTTTKEGSNKVESDHNVLITKFTFSWNKRTKQEKIQMYNLKNKQNQAKFKEETSHNKYLLSAFDDDTEDLEVSAYKFIKRLNITIHKCFQKIRMTKKLDMKTEKLYETWRRLHGKEDSQSKEDLKKVEKELADKIADNYKTIEEETSKFNCVEGGFNSGKLWNLKKHMFPNNRDPPTAMVNDEGNLVTSNEDINELALQKLAVERLKNRPMKEDLLKLKTQKELLCEKKSRKG